MPLAQCLSPSGRPSEPRLRRYPGTHWTAHGRLLTKHLDAYEKSLGSVFYGTHTFEMLALILMADYDKLADRFVGCMPANAETELFGCGTHDKDAVARPVCPISHAEARELIKRRLQVCWWGPRATKEVDVHAGASFVKAKEWDPAGGLGWEDGAKIVPPPATAAAAAAAAATKGERPRRRTSAAPARAD